jgi:hypothetical protein
MQANTVYYVFAYKFIHEQSILINDVNTPSLLTEIMRTHSALLFQAKQCSLVSIIACFIFNYPSQYIVLSFF